MNLWKILKMKLLTKTKKSTNLDTSAEAKLIRIITPLIVAEELLQLVLLAIQADSARVY